MHLLELLQNQFRLLLLLFADDHLLLGVPFDLLQQLLGSSVVVVVENKTERYCLNLRGTSPVNFNFSSNYLGLFPSEFVEGFLCVEHYHAEEAAAGRRIDLTDAQLTGDDVIFKNEQGIPLYTC